MVFASGDLRISDMAKPGFVANWIAILSLSLFMFSIGLPIYKIQIDTLPDWASK